LDNWLRDWNDVRTLWLKTKESPEWKIFSTPFFDEMMDEEPLRMAA
jgi:hypothetical protein